MNTYMTEATFDRLREIGDALRKNQMDVAPVFVPWAGGNLESQGGLYYIGQATDGSFEPGKTAFRDRLECTRELCDRKHDRKHTPFWRFLNGLTTHLFAGPFYETSDRWGWSNLLKIALVEGSPRDWPDRLIDPQSGTCIEALQEEVARLRNSLIFIASNHDFGIIARAFGCSGWNKSYENDGIYWRQGASGNLIVHGYHPAGAQRGRFFDQMLKTTIQLAGENLRWVKPGSSAESELNNLPQG